MERNEVLKADGWKDWETLETDQKQGLPQPPVQKPYPEDATLIDLVTPAASGSSGCLSLRPSGAGGAAGALALSP